MQVSSTITNGFRAYWSRVAGFGPTARLLLGSNIRGGIVLNIYDLLFNFYLTSLGHSADCLGQISSLTQVVVFVSSLPAGMLSDAIGRKASLIGGIGVTTLALLGYVLFPS